MRDAGHHGSSPGSCTRPAVILDCGSASTKLGFAGNAHPTFVIPTVVGHPNSSQSGLPRIEADDTHFYTGDDATSRATSCWLRNPIQHGNIEDWDDMERFWQDCFVKYLRIDTEDHPAILTESPLATSESRELLAEVMFETFNIPALHIGSPAVMALYAAYAWGNGRGKAVKSALTGTVIDSGEVCTHIVPVVDGYIIQAAVQSLPIAGRHITGAIQQALRERGNAVPPEMSLDAAKAIKERFCYVTSDPVKEARQYTEQPETRFCEYTGTNPKTGQSFTCRVGPEQFLGPEALFTPGSFATPLASSITEVVDLAIQACPIDARRVLYGNIVLSGGSTLFRDFGRRLQRDMQRRVDLRLGNVEQSRMRVLVASHPMQRYAAFFGASILGMMPEFPSTCRSRAQYEESGPSIFREFVPLKA